MNEKSLKKVKPKIDKGDMIFYCVFLAWPVLQFAVFYIGVNFNSVIMSFQSATTKKFTWSHYIDVFNFMKTSDFKGYLGVTLKGFALSTLIGTPLGLLFAYYIYKKLFGWGAFRVILFLPKIISGVVIALMFRWFIDQYIPAILPGLGESLLATERQDSTTFPLMMFYYLWIGFGTSVLMYSNKMSSISEEIIESAHLDGASGLKEFWYIVLPLSFSTVSVFLITGIAALFTNQFGAYELYRGSSFADTNAFKSVGYFFFVEVQRLSSTLSALGEMPPQLHYYAAFGLVLTVITIPIALTVRWAAEKYGPSED